MFHQQFMKEFFLFGGFGEVWGILPGYVGKIIERAAFLQVFGAIINLCMKRLVWLPNTRQQQVNDRSIHVDVQGTL